MLTVNITNSGSKELHWGHQVGTLIAWHFVDRPMTFERAQWLHLVSQVDPSPIYHSCWLVVILLPRFWPEPVAASISSLCQWLDSLLEGLWLDFTFQTRAVSNRLDSFSAVDLFDTCPAVTKAMVFEKPGLGGGMALLLVLLSSSTSVSCQRNIVLERVLRGSNFVTPGLSYWWSFSLVLQTNWGLHVNIPDFCNLWHYNTQIIDFVWQGMCFGPVYISFSFPFPSFDLSTRLAFVLLAFILSPFFPLSLPACGKVFHSTPCSNAGFVQSWC